VAEDFAQQPAGLVPELPGPHPLYRVATRELAEDRVDPVAHPGHEGAPFRMGIALLVSVRCHQLNASPGQLFPFDRRPVAAIPNHHTRGALDEVREHRELVDVGQGHAQAGDHSRPADPYVP
jgi:hypothetical protein